jgi:hypothetical protein
VVEGTVTMVVDGLDALTASRTRAMPVMKKSALTAARAFIEEELFFIIN